MKYFVTNKNAFYFIVYTDEVKQCFDMCHFHQSEDDMYRYVADVREYNGVPRNEMRSTTIIVIDCGDGTIDVMDHGTTNYEMDASEFVSNYEM